MDEVAKRMADLAERLGPSVIDAARGAARVEAYSSMMASGIALFVGIVLMVVGRIWWRKRDQEDDFIDGYRGAAFGCWAMSAILFFPGVWGFLDPWVWTAIHNPDLWIAHRFMKGH